MAEFDIPHPGNRHGFAWRVRWCLVVVGACALVLASSLPLGTVERVGPGLFPLIAAGTLLVCAIWLVWRPGDEAADDSMPPVDGAASDRVPSTDSTLRAAWTLGGVAAFALLQPLLGSTIAIAVTGVCAARSVRTPLPTALAVGAIGSLMLHLLFVFGLGLRLIG